MVDHYRGVAGNQEERKKRGEIDADDFVARMEDGPMQPVVSVFR